ncbi:hypothetical protein L1276_000616 [Flavobacterium sp. HSC-32F16]|uniref:hypothetical protein n=1 Tax=Flavobacterium sp. HSC-32F16 TaxID=2910964 RepID=UPI0020A32400|nr:hypothetical protein [Flavobacterium sp. HSC-32F16]MCP2025476.1 hypothetical protein [Flavobacterium sp. HSC-32F16]
MKISKNLVLGVLLILIIACRENTSKQDSRNLKNILEVNNSKIPSDTKEIKNTINKSLVISCGSGCAMTYTAESIQSEAPTIKVKFKVEMYLDEKISDTYYEVYIFKYDTSNIIIKIQPEGKNENILENLLPDAQESFKKFSIDLIKDKNLEIKPSETCFKESKIKLPYAFLNTKILKYSLLDCNSISGIERYNCNSEKLRYISLPNREDVNVVLVPQDCGDFDYRYYLLTIKNNTVIDNLYVEGEWYEPEDEENKETTTFSIDKDYNLIVRTQIGTSSKLQNFIINKDGKIIKR